MTCRGGLAGVVTAVAVSIVSHSVGLAQSKPTVAVAPDAPNAPVRIVASDRGRIVTLDAMLDGLGSADVLVVGEQHTDDNTHRVELAILQGLARRGVEVVLALEMFERDVQEPLARFVTGRLAESEFLAQARPWPRYETDYKALVDLAAAQHWPVVAANVPRTIAADVSRDGLQALASRSDAERAWFARDPQCPLRGANYDRFRRAMSGSLPSEGSAAASLDRYYLAQCLKDETMAESIAQAHAAARLVGRRPLVVSINGAFHSDRHGGLIDGLARRMDGARLVVATILPVPDPATANPDRADRQRADYLVYTAGDRPPDLSESAVPAGAHTR